MKAWCAPRCGDPAEVLAFEELPDPQIQPGHAYIEVLAVGLSYADVLMCQGTYQFPTPLPYVPGGETVGVVRAVAEPATHGHLVGRLVFVLGGGLQHLTVDPYESIFPLPDGTDAASVAALPVNYATAAFCLREIRAVEEKEWVLVLGAAGGLGAAVVDYAMYLGARVIAVVGGGKKVGASLAQGRADVVLDYQDHEDFRDAVMEETDGEGVSACIDPVGGSVSATARRCIKWRGTHVVVGFASGSVPEVPLNHVLVKGYDIAGANWGGFILRHPDTVAPAVRHVLELHQRGELHPLSTVYEFTDARTALVAHAHRESIGKVVVRT